MEPTKVLQINSALSSKPFFVKLGNLENPSIDTIAHLAIRQLNTQGKPLEAQQLEALFEKHQIFNGNQAQTKGTLFNDLVRTSKTVGVQPIELAEITLLTAHAGGTDSVKGLTLIFDKPVKVGSPYLMALMDYLLLTKNVVEISPSINTADDDIALMKAKHDLKMQLFATLR